MTIAIGCPTCFTEVGVPDNAQGQVMTCPSCQQPFQVPPAAAPRPVTPRPAAPRSVSPGDTDQLPRVGPGLPRAKADGVKMNYQNGTWTATISGRRMATCPGVYLSGTALLYGLLSLVGLGIPSINLFLLAIMGFFALAGWRIAHHFYYKRWTDLASRDLPKAQTPQPWWIWFLMIAPGLAVAAAIGSSMAAEESREIREEAYQRYAGRGDAKLVRDAVDRFHARCYDAAHQRIIKRRIFFKSRYFELMDERILPMLAPAPPAKAWRGFLIEERRVCRATVGPEERPGLRLRLE